MALNLSFCLLFAAALVPSSFAALYTSPSQLPRTTYDYVIVGGMSPAAVHQRFPC